MSPSFTLLTEAREPPPQIPWLCPLSSLLLETPSGLLWESCASRGTKTMFHPVGGAGSTKDPGGIPEARGLGGKQTSEILKGSFPEPS